MFTAGGGGPVDPIGGMALGGRNPERVKDWSILDYLLGSSYQPDYNSIPLRNTSVARKIGRSGTWRHLHRVESWSHKGGRGWRWHPRRKGWGR